MTHDQSLHRSVKKATAFLTPLSFALEPDESYMRIVGWPTVWKEEEGLLPVEVQDIDIHLSTEELAQLATFLTAASKASTPSIPQELTIDFADSKENPKTGITVTVHVPGHF